MFNHGWLCPQCGPVKHSKKRSIKKVRYDCCRKCNSVVTAWERPLNERVGRCSNCGHGGFELALHNHHLLRRCKACNQVYNIDAETVVRSGNA